MNDRELLELAARAAGYYITEGSQGYRTFYCNGGVEWNPLTNDGDALRLATKLRINVVYYEEVDSVAARRDLFNEESIFIVNALDDYGVRNAIVQAAAEIGKTVVDDGNV